MRIVENMCTRSDCYLAGRTITVKGLMIHSVGCPQPKAQPFINNWNKPGVKACVHAIIEPDGDVYQLLPWNHRGWHAGGNANNTHIGVEMCEPDCIRYTRGAAFTCSDVNHAREVVRKTYEVAVELFAKLCTEYCLNPLEDGVIISHREGHKRNIASNHGDPEHLWMGLGLPYTMDTFRKAVHEKMGTKMEDTTDCNPEKRIWDFLLSQIGNEYGVAGLMGNLYAESGLNPKNLQNTYNKKLNISDEEYTMLVDGGNYPDFITDKAGYGLAQWTYYTRKQNLLNYAKQKGTSIGNLDLQLEFLLQELTGYRNVYQTLIHANTVREAAVAVLTGFEKPANQSETVCKKRTAYGQRFYDKYASDIPSNSLPFKVRVEITDLNIRIGAGTNYAKTGKCTGMGVFTIVEVQDGKGSKTGWGKLKSGQGWISLDYTTRI